MVFPRGLWILESIPEDAFKLLQDEILREILKELLQEFWLELQMVLSCGVILGSSTTETIGNTIYLIKVEKEIMNKTL